MSTGELAGGEAVGPPNVNVLVAPDQTGARHLLLTRHVTTGQLRLPNDLLDASMPVDGDVRLSLFDESHISAWNVPAKDVFLGDAQGAHGAGKPQGFLRILPYIPEATPSDDFEAFWMPVEEVTQESDRPTLPNWYGDHESVVATATAYMRGYDATMRLAQAEHSMGNFAAAEGKWREAAGMLPDVMSRGWALRGLAASLDRVGDEEAKKVARLALDLHETYVGVVPATVRPRIARELIESNGVMGRIVLRPTLEAEQSGDLTEEQGRVRAEGALYYFGRAVGYAIDVENATGPEPDQHKINLLSRFIIAHSLYGDPQEARRWTHEAIRIARRSEVEGLPTSNKSLQDIDRDRARRVAIARSWAAWSISNLVRYGAYGRRKALNIAAGRLGL